MLPPALSSRLTASLQSSAVSYRHQHGCHPAGREGPGHSLLQSTREASSPWLQDCPSWPALLMGPSSHHSLQPLELSSQSALHTKPWLLTPLRSGLQLGSEQRSSRVRSQAGARRDRVGTDTPGQLEVSVFWNISPLPGTTSPAGRQTLEPRALC